MSLEVNDDGVLEPDVPLLNIGDSVTLNGRGEVIPLGSTPGVGQYVVGNVSKLELVMRRVPDVIDRLASLEDEELAKEVAAFDKDMRQQVVRATIRMTTPFDGEATFFVGDGS